MVKTRKNSSNPIVVSLFTGAGGLDEGFRAAGYQIGCCVELEEWACDTLRLNHPETPVMGPPDHSGDVKQITGDEILQYAGLKAGEVDVLIGGPPCQPFSQAATQRFLKGDDRFKRQGFDDDLKGTLLFDFIRLALELKPKAFLLENVPGLMTIDGGKQIKEALRELQDAGYHVTTPRVVNAVDYGVPQYRQRLIVWGSRRVKSPVLPEPTHSPIPGLFRKGYKTVAEALAGMPQDLPNNATRAHSEDSIKRYRTLEFGKREKLGRVDRLDPRMPSKTVIAGGMHGGGRSHLHPFIARTITVREDSRLQTFQDDYVFAGSIARQFTQAGNAVPPLLAEVLARQIKKQEFGESFTEPFVHGRYLERDKSVEELVEQLLKESRAQKPEWIYYSHAKQIVPVR